MRPLGSSVRRQMAAVLFLGVFAVACTAGTSPAHREHPPSATSSSAFSFPVTITDDDGARVTIPTEPKRIVTFAPSMTEIVYALGLGEWLVGVSGPSDDYPPAARQVEEVGGAGEFGVDPNVEKVVALEPDLLLTISGGDQWKQALRDLGVPVVTLNATDFEDLLSDIRAVGRLTGATAQATSLTGDMQARADAVSAEVTRRVSCFFEVYDPPLITVGPHTFVYDLLERAGCDPVTAGAKGDYPEWSVDDLVAESPQIYIATPESAKSPAAIASRPGFDGIAAVRDGRVVLVNADLVTRPGPRAVDGLEQLVTVLQAPGD